MGVILILGEGEKSIIEGGSDGAGSVLVVVEEAYDSVGGVGSFINEGKDEDNEVSYLPLTLSLSSSFVLCIRLQIRLKNSFRKPLRFFDWVWSF
jgi:hypothetical protein